MDVVKEDTAEVEVTEEDTVDRNNWRRKIRCGDPRWEKPKEEEETKDNTQGKVFHFQTNTPSMCAYRLCANRSSFS